MSGYADSAVTSRWLALPAYLNTSLYTTPDEASCPAHQWDAATRTCNQTCTGAAWSHSNEKNSDLPIHPDATNSVAAVLDFGGIHTGETLKRRLLANQRYQSLAGKYAGAGAVDVSTDTVREKLRENKYENVRKVPRACEASTPMCVGTAHPLIRYEDLGSLNYIARHTGTLANKDANTPWTLADLGESNDMDAGECWHACMSTRATACDDENGALAHCNPITGRQIFVDAPTGDLSRSDFLRNEACACRNLFTYTDGSQKDTDWLEAQGAHCQRVCANTDRAVEMILRQPVRHGDRDGVFWKQTFTEARGARIDLLVDRHTQWRNSDESTSECANSCKDFTGEHDSYWAQTPFRQNCRGYDTMTRDGQSRCVQANTDRLLTGRPYGDSYKSQKSWQRDSIRPADLAIGQCVAMTPPGMDFPLNGACFRYRRNEAGDNMTIEPVVDESANVCRDTLFCQPPPDSLAYSGSEQMCGEGASAGDACKLRWCPDNDPQCGVQHIEGTCRPLEDADPQVCGRYIRAQAALGVDACASTAPLNLNRLRGTSTDLLPPSAQVTPYTNRLRVPFVRVNHHLHKTLDYTRIDDLQAWGLSKDEAKERCRNHATCNAISTNKDDWTFFFSGVGDIVDAADLKLDQRGAYGEGWQSFMLDPRASGARWTHSNARVSTVCARTCCDINRTGSQCQIATGRFDPDVRSTWERTQQRALNNGIAISEFVTCGQKIASESGVAGGQCLGSQCMRAAVAATRQRTGLSVDFHVPTQACRVGAYMPDACDGGTVRVPVFKQLPDAVEVTTLLGCGNVCSATQLSPIRRSPDAELTELVPSGLGLTVSGGVPFADMLMTIDECSSEAKKRGRPFFAMVGGPSETYPNGEEREFRRAVVEYGNPGHPDEPVTDTLRYVENKKAAGKALCIPMSREQYNDVREKNRNTPGDACKRPSGNYTGAAFPLNKSGQTPWHFNMICNPNNVDYEMGNKPDESHKIAALYALSNADLDDQQRCDQSSRHFWNETNFECRSSGAECAPANRCSNDESRSCVFDSDCAEGASCAAAQGSCAAGDVCERKPACSFGYTMTVEGEPAGPRREYCRMLLEKRTSQQLVAGAQPGFQAKCLCNHDEVFDATRGACRLRVRADCDETKEVFRAGECVPLAFERPPEGSVVDAATGLQRPVEARDCFFFQKYTDGECRDLEQADCPAGTTFRLGVCQATTSQDCEDHEQFVESPMKVCRDRIESDCTDTVFEAREQGGGFCRPCPNTHILVLGEAGTSNYCRPRVASDCADGTVFTAN